MYAIFKHETSAEPVSKALGVLNLKIANLVTNIYGDPHTGWHLLFQQSAGCKQQPSGGHGVSNGSTAVRLWLTVLGAGERDIFHSLLLEFTPPAEIFDEFCFVKLALPLPPVIGVLMMVALMF